MRTVSSYTLLNPRRECSCRFRIFPPSVSISGPLEGRFRAKVFEKAIFRCDFLTGGPNCKPSAPTAYSTLGGNARLGFGFSLFRFHFRTPEGRFRPKVFEKPIFWCDSLTESPIFEPSAPTAYSTLGGSARVGFGFFPLPFPFSEPRRAVFEPKCSKNSCFGVIL